MQMSAVSMAQLHRMILQQERYADTATRLPRATEDDLDRPAKVWSIYRVISGYRSQWKQERYGLFPVCSLRSCLQQALL